MERAIKVYLPKWALALYVIMGIILIPWTVHLASTLPPHHIEGHWDMVWVGFDFIMLCNVLLTLWFMARRVVWVVVSASALGTLLLIDAWFDITTARGGQEVHEASLYALLEVSLAILTYRLVYVVIHHATPQKNFRLHVKSKKR